MQSEQTDSSQIKESIGRLFDAVQKLERPEKTLTLAEWLSDTDKRFTIEQKRKLQFQKLVEAHEDDLMIILLDPTKRIELKKLAKK